MLFQPSTSAIGMHISLQLVFTLEVAWGLETRGWSVRVGCNRGLGPQATLEEFYQHLCVCITRLPHEQR